MSTLTLTLIQTQLHWEDKTANLAMLEQKIMSISEHTEIVVLPEMFSTGFSMNPAKLAEDMNGKTVQWMKRVAAAKKIILTGSCDHSGRRELLQPPTLGFAQWEHRRLRQAPPLCLCRRRTTNIPAGNKRLVAQVKGWKINLLVCYDLRFPVWARQQNNEQPEYDVLFYVANWPQRRAHAWKTLLTARAIENQSYVIGVNRVGEDGNQINYNGESMVVDPLGEVLYQKAADEAIFSP
jgi:omega-amidase